MRQEKEISRWATSGPEDQPLGIPARVVTVSLPQEVRGSLPPHILAPNAEVRQIELKNADSIPFVGPSAPTLVLSPLIAPGFDAMDLLTILREIRFEGRFLVLAPAMPDIPLIRAEMLAQADGLDVDIIALNAPNTLHEV